ncbi:MAG: DNA-processing protein DprA [Myxococcota bacterium]
MDGMERRVVAALWSLPEVGIKTVEAVRAAFPAMGELLERPLRSWLGEVDLRQPAVDVLSRVECLASVADRLDRSLARLGYEMIFPDHPGWPPALKRLREMPPVLFKLGPGAEGPPRRRVALVGTRNPETGSTHQVRRLAAELAWQGVGVVSGAAEGIDRVAHLGALDAGGETWAFLGCAIEQMDVAQAILKKPFLSGDGTFFSQFPPGRRPDKGTFVMRNEWISGAADAVIIARAPRDSGALITARHARDQQRPLLAMPGDPWNKAAVGSNALLRDGARPCLSVGDVLAALGLTGTLSPRPEGEDRPRNPLSPAAEQVLAALTLAATSFDELMERLTPMDPADAAAALLELELAGAALQRAGKRFERVS